MKKTHCEICIQFLCIDNLIIFCERFVTPNHLNKAMLALGGFLSAISSVLILNYNHLHISQGTIDGVLLVTPNAVMFDPNVSHPMVMEKGAEEFGMIAQMDTIMSAAIYHDLEAMERLQQRKFVF